MVVHICNSSYLGRRLALGKNARPRQAQVAHAYNPSYSGGKDQEDHGSKLTQARLHLKKKGW
jgi:hypothetical protein